MKNHESNKEIEDDLKAMNEYLKFGYKMKIPKSFRSPLDQLTFLQNEVGYVKGNINNVALLGLFGEAGEVLNECKIKEDGVIKPLPLEGAIEKAEQVDRLKKAIRDKEAKVHEIIIEDEEKFDSEMADVFYYFNALAINRGKTINDYAEISCKKVMKYKNQKDIRHANISHGSK